MEAFQKRFKEESKGQGGDLVLFTDALEHLTRLCRVRSCFNARPPMPLSSSAVSSATTLRRMTTVACLCQADHMALVDRFWPWIVLQRCWSGWAAPASSPLPAWRPT